MAVFDRAIRKSVKALTYSLTFMVLSTQDEDCSNADLLDVTRDYLSLSFSSSDSQRWLPSCQPHEQTVVPSVEI